MAHLLSSALNQQHPFSVARVSGSTVTYPHRNNAHSLLVFSVTDPYSFDPYPDLLRIRIQGFDDQNFMGENFLYIKNFNLPIPMPT
jgi:hypothetical protein